MLNKIQTKDNQITRDYAQNKQQNQLYVRIWLPQRLCCVESEYKTALLLFANSSTELRLFVIRLDFWSAIFFSVSYQSRSYFTRLCAVCTTSDNQWTQNPTKLKRWTEQQQKITARLISEADTETNWPKVRRHIQWQTELNPNCRVLNWRVLYNVVSHLPPSLKKLLGLRTKFPIKYNQLEANIRVSHTRPLSI